MERRQEKRETVHIRVKEFSKKDIPKRVEWLNNPKVNRYIGEGVGQTTTLKKEQRWFESYVKADQAKFFTIYDKAKPIGMMGFSNISEGHRNADIFIAIGEDAYRGKGYGRKALEWLIEYGFSELNLHKINLGVVKENAGAIKLYKSLGFIIEGEMRDEVVLDGEFHDFYSMALFEPEL